MKYDARRCQHTGGGKKRLEGELFFYSSCELEAIIVLRECANIYTIIVRVF
jgi:hypothetical protein